MDDFFKFLIWAIIIISFISSFFKKDKGKKKPSPQQRRPNNPNRDKATAYPQTSSTTMDSDQNDVFKEIEKLFKTENTQQAPPIPPQERTTAKRQTTIEKTEAEAAYDEQKSIDMMDKVWNEESTSEHTPKTDWDYEKKKIAELDKTAKSKIDMEAKRFEKFLTKEEKYDSRTLRTLKERLKHPQSLKEFIVISEIIGKPVSRRSRTRIPFR